MRDRILTLIFILFIIQSGLAQNDPLSQMNQLRVQANQKGMVVLGGWAIGNILLGANRYDKTSQNQHFYRMNLYFNLVNLGLSTTGYLNSVGESFDRLSDEDKIKKQHKIEKLYLFNSGLDVGYIMGGLYLMEKGRNSESNRIEGYGKSLILQGGFLLLFDSIMYLKHNSNRKKLAKYTILPAASTNGIGMKILIK